jgi:hypothetical protein
MTEQKPPGVSWESWIEEQIRRAREESAFDRLSGVGKPLPDLGDSYDPDWWVKQLLRRERVSVLPPALELLRKTELELSRIWQVRDEREVRARVTALNAEIAKINATAGEGPPTRLAPLDVDALVLEWRSRQRPVQQ